MARIVIRRSFLIAVAGFAVGLSIVPARAEEPKGDLKAMQGTWISKDEQGESTWVIKDDHVSIKTPTRGSEMTLKLDGAAKPEKSADFKVLNDSPNAKGADGKAIYKVDGGAISFCLAIGDNGRPKEFKNDFPNSVLFELKKK